MSPKPDIGLTNVLLFVCCWFSLWFLQFSPWPLWLFWFVWFSLWFLIFSAGFKGKPVRRRIRLHIFSLLHPLFLTKGLLISQRVAHSPPLDLNIDVASATCVPAIRMSWAGKLNIGNHFAQACLSMKTTITITVEFVCMKRQCAQHKRNVDQIWKRYLKTCVFGNTLVLWVAFVLCVAARYPFVLKSIVVLKCMFSVNCITKPAVQPNFLKTKASKHHGTTFHKKNIDFIGTAPILQHSCPIVFSMIFALRT